MQNAQLLVTRVKPGSHWSRRSLPAYQHQASHAEQLQQLPAAGIEHVHVQLLRNWSVIIRDSLLL